MNNVHLYPEPQAPLLWQWYKFAELQRRPATPADIKDLHRELDAARCELITMLRKCGPIDGLWLSRWCYFTPDARTGLPRLHHRLWWEAMISTFRVRDIPAGPERESADILAENMTPTVKWIDMVCTEVTPVLFYR